MKIQLRFIAINDNNDTEEELEIGKVYEFKESNYAPQIGKLIKINNDEVTFDRSSEFHSYIETHKIFALHYIRQVQKQC